MPNHLEQAYPGVAQALPRLDLVEQPTPAASLTLDAHGLVDTIGVKFDNLTSSLYGGNKVRKLEYLLARAQNRHARRIATFGAVASNHATATSLFSRQLGFECLCFLSHQTRTPAAARALNMHVRLGSKVIRYGGERVARLRTLRENLPGEKVWAIPLGGTSWLGAVGFVNAGLELAQQVRDGDIEQPDEIYVAMGTMGTVAGLALGLALGGNPARVQAVRVTDEQFANPGALDRLVRKTATLLHRIDPDIPSGLERRVRLQYRPEFFGDGYARTNPETDMAVSLASSELGLTLEPTYTGKAFRALLHDRQQNEAPKQRLFWNTYNSIPLPVATHRPDNVSAIPEEFLSYFDQA